MQDQESKSWRIYLLIIAVLLIVLSFLWPERGWSQTTTPPPGTLAVTRFSLSDVPQIDFAWDANIEPDLKGYKIYWGKMSRKDSSLYSDKALIYTAVKLKYCDGKLGALLTECEKEIDDFCPSDDAFCDFDFYKYDGVVDVENVTEYTLVEASLRGTIYFAATAYDDKGEESKFSNELTHTFFRLLGAPKKLTTEEKK